MAIKSARKFLVGTCYIDLVSSAELHLYSFFVGPLSVRPRRGKILLLLVLLVVTIGLSSNSVLYFTPNPSETHITIHFPKAHDTDYPLPMQFVTDSDSDTDTDTDTDTDNEKND